MFEVDLVAFLVPFGFHFCPGFQAPVGGHSMQGFDPYFITRFIFTARKLSLRRLCFYTCLSVHGGSTWAGTPTKTRYTPRPGTPQDQVHHPRTRYIPPGPDTPPSGPGTPPSGPGTPPRTRYTPPRTRYPQDKVPPRTRYPQD